MAKSPHGPYGHLNGRVGDLVHYTLKGQSIVRMIGIITKAPTTKQKANRQAMSVIMDLLRPALRFINAGFELEARNTVCNPHNLAVSYNKKHALKGEYPKLEVDYSKVQFSQGVLPLANGLKMEREAGGIRISWDPKHQDQGDYADDIVMVVAIRPAKERAECMLNAGQRGTGTCFLPLDPSDQTQTEVYLCFKSSDGSGVSKTAYLGNLNGLAGSAMHKAQQKKYKEKQARFARLEAAYVKQVEENGGVKPKYKRFLALEREYEALKRWLDDHPEGVCVG